MAWKPRKTHENKNALIIVKMRSITRSIIEGFKPVIWFIKRRFKISHNKSRMINGKIPNHAKPKIQNNEAAKAVYSPCGYISRASAQEKKVTNAKTTPKTIESRILFPLERWINIPAMNAIEVKEIINWFGKYLGSITLPKVNINCLFIRLLKKALTLKYCLFLSNSWGWYVELEVED